MTAYGVWRATARHHGQAVGADLILAGDDIVSVDALAAYLIGLDCKLIRHIMMADKKGAGRLPETSELDKFKALKHKFKPAALYEKFGKNIYVWPTDGCSKCITALNESGKLFKKHPIKFRKFLQKAYFGDEKINIVIGNAKGLKLGDNEKIICIGHCPRKFADRSGCGNLDKCPPSVADVLKYLNQELS